MCTVEYVAIGWWWWGWVEVLDEGNSGGESFETEHDGKHPVGFLIGGDREGDGSETECTQEVSILVS